MQNQQNESYKKQLDLYKEYIDKTRAMRHDWKNHLGVIEVMTENHQIAEVYKKSIERLSENKKCTLFETWRGRTIAILWIR